MSNYLPFEIQSEILKRLPVKSLIQFRSVCKSWNSLIKSSDFIAHYRSQQQRLLVRYVDEVTNEVKCVSIVDDNDHTFPNQRISVTLPPLVQQASNYLPIGSSHGLLCFFGPCRGWRAVIWNPCIRKAVSVVVPYMVDDGEYRTVVGFGVCRETIEPKLVKITHSQIRLHPESATFVPWQVEVFTLSTGAWRSPYSTSILPRNSIYLNWIMVVVDGCLYLLASDWLCGFHNLIISFDMTSEEFREVNLPDSLALISCSLSMYKLRESLVVIEDGSEDNESVYRVWMMEDDVAKSFNKLFTIRRNHSPDVSIDHVRGFRKTGEPLLEVTVRAHRGSNRILAAYDPYSKSISNAVLDRGHFSVYSYMETLLLL